MNDTYTATNSSISYTAFLTDENYTSERIDIKKHSNYFSKERDSDEEKRKKKIKKLEKWKLKMKSKNL